MAHRRRTNLRGSHEGAWGNHGCHQKRQGQVGGVRLVIYTGQRNQVNQTLSHEVLYIGTSVPTNVGLQGVFFISRCLGLHLESVQDIAAECLKQHPHGWNRSRKGPECEEKYRNMEAEMSCIQNYDGLSGHQEWHSSTVEERCHGLSRLADGNATKSSMTKLQNSYELYIRMLETAGRLPSNDPPMLLSSGGERLVF